MNILLLGAAGFIGTNLTISLANQAGNKITLVDSNKSYFERTEKLRLSNVKYFESPLDENCCFDELLKDQDIVYHLVSTNTPTSSNRCVQTDLDANLRFSSTLFDACVRNNVNKVVFVSSGGTVYGKEVDCPLTEDTPTNPISSYGLQKVMIEKMLYLYNYIYGLDYCVVRLANPYGPYQRPNGVLGAVTTFIYKALKEETITVYGDGSVIRDFLYIDDAVRGIQQIVEGNSVHRIFNLGCGYGTSINQLISVIEKALNRKLKVEYREGRRVDVPVNYLDISRYEQCFGTLNPLPLYEGIIKTAEFMKKELL